ncbi:hypothetical protein M0P48_04120 [Candidatus Gracilibacteria bacterium]|nr:hypothetical protein [Candidatus Gracilibacteria bacterium]
MELDNIDDEEVSVNWDDGEDLGASDSLGVRIDDVTDLADLEPEIRMLNGVGDSLGDLSDREVMAHMHTRFCDVGVVKIGPKGGLQWLDDGNVVDDQPEVDEKGLGKNNGSTMEFHVVAPGLCVGRLVARGGEKSPWYLDR